MDLLKLLEVFGLPTALVFYFLWRDRGRDRVNLERENRLAKRLNEVEDYVRNQLGSVVRECTAVIGEEINTQREFAATFEKLCVVLTSRPCMVGKIKIVSSDGKLGVVVEDQEGGDGG